MKISSTFFVAGCTFAACSAHAFSGANLGFETGDLTGWNTLGAVSISDASSGIVPLTGNYDAVLTAGSASLADIAAFAGDSTADFESEFFGDPNYDLTFGSALQTTINVVPGDDVQEYARFVTGDSYPYNDTAFLTIAPVGGGQAFTINLNDVDSVGASGDSGWQASGLTYSGAPASYLFTWSVFNAGDNLVPSQLYVDLAPAQNSGATPSPAAAIPFALGLLGRLRRKRRS